MAGAKKIHINEELDAALARIGDLLKANPGDPEYDELNLLSDLVKAYDDEHYTIGLPSVIAAVEFHMDQHGLTPDDLVPLIGNKQKVLEVLSGNRDITMPMARALHKHWRISAGVLLQAPGE